ncbi:ArsR/SmtB family transcription factor [Halobium salinum]|uniref:ArsR/SmtB family transcription factor n=2 Tax=Halobium salinum TaxID=1364940 RepID=A0ABD5P995_9EURY
MADLLPSSSDVSGPETDEPRVVGVDSDAADDLLAALSSRTARRALTELHEEPATPARLAERVDTSLQNVQYHLGKLEDAGLVEVADTVYSEKGREMKVYAPADRALVVVAGREEETTGLKATLKRLLGSVGVLGIASLLVDRLLSPGGFWPFAAGGGASGGSDGDAAPTDGLGDESAGGSGGESADGGSAGGVDTGADLSETTGTRTTGAQTTAADGADGAGTTAESTATSAETATTAADGAQTTEAAEATRTATETAATTAVDTTSGAAADTTASGAADTTAAETTTTAVRTAAEAASGGATEPTTVVSTLATSPGLLFFLGGLTALLLVVLLARR